MSCSLENADFTDKAVKIDSPTSIQALKKMKVKQGELVFLTEKEFRIKFPANLKLKITEFKQKYSEFEANRLKKINKLKEVAF